MSDKPKVYIVDDDAGMRRSMSLILETANLAYEAFESAEAFLQSIPNKARGCLTLDLHMPGMNGLDLVSQMRNQKYSIPVLMISGTGTIPLAVEGMKLGLFDFLVKPVDPEVFLSKVHAALLLDDQQRNDAASLNEIRRKLGMLTPRETQLLKLIVGGFANKNIASELGISIKTVENHRASLMAKTGALNAADLVRMKMLVTEA
jgi:two-component system response regulator FixJ